MDEHYLFMINSISGAFGFRFFLTPRKRKVILYRHWKLSALRNVSWKLNITEAYYKNAIVGNNGSFKAFKARVWYLHVLIYLSASKKKAD